MKPDVIEILVAWKAKQKFCETDRPQNNYKYFNEKSIYCCLYAFHNVEVWDLVYEHLIHHYKL